MATKADRYVHADDTGARHDGKNGYCTHIGNELFAWFSGTESKSRINFLSCLGEDSAQSYVLSAGALAIWSNRNYLPCCWLILKIKQYLSEPKPKMIGKRGWKAKE